ncbi:MAG: hypothetical protein JXA46_19680 [Dehalococcoidales bacterium]|nr:hypothetical protein [Dehalococcoidales bacterium]
MKKSENMLSSKRCPKCGQNSIYLDFDVYGWYQCCWQCGYYKDLPSIKNKSKKWFGLNDAAST